MPFKSIKQQKACWAKYNRDIKAGRVPAWNCYTFGKHKGGAIVLITIKKKR